MTTPPILSYQDVELDLLSRTAKRGKRVLSITAKQFALLEYLVRNPDRVISRAQLLDGVWNLKFEPGSNLIDVCISMLRRKLDHDAATHLIHTVKGAGYLFGDSSRAHKPIDEGAAQV